VDVEGHLFQKEWTAYRRRQWAFWVSVVIVLPLTAMTELLTDRYPALRSVGGVSSTFIVFASCAAACMAANFLLFNWKCPSCGKSFHTKWWRKRSFPANCINCKFPKYKGSDFFKETL
jgi:hypothetical protein